MLVHMFPLRAAPFFSSTTLDLWRREDGTEARFADVPMSRFAHVRLFFPARDCNADSQEVHPGLGSDNREMFQRIAEQTFSSLCIVFATYPFVLQCYGSALLDVASQAGYVPFSATVLWLRPA